MPFTWTPGYVYIRAMHYRPIFVLATVCALAACEPNVETRGHLRDADWQQDIVINQTTRDEILDKLGTPSTRASFGPETWYYVSTRRESYAFLKPEVTEENVIAISFGPDGVVQDIQQLRGEEAKDIEVVERITPTEGHQMTFMEQLLGNLGRFNSPGSGAGSNKRAPGTGM
jgi:outer membrane protein assembly factor BamE (lipoprotein component of BamABCDE complex)